VRAAAGVRGHRGGDDDDVSRHHPGATDTRAPAGCALLGIGLGPTPIHLVSIPVTATSVNPARSTGVAVFAGGWALEQLWRFWVAPIAGALLGATVYRLMADAKDQAPAVAGRRYRHHCM